MQILNILNEYYQSEVIFLTLVQLTWFFSFRNRFIFIIKGFVIFLSSLKFLSANNVKRYVEQFSIKV